MAISIDKQFGAAQYALQLRAQRASILANNIANADTPGFKARDMDFNAMLKAKMGEASDALPMTASETGNMQGLLQSDTLDGLKYRNPSEFVRNTMEYQAAFQFLNGRIKSLLTAIKGE